MTPYEGARHRRRRLHRLEPRPRPARARRRRPRARQLLHRQPREPRRVEDDVEIVEGELRSYERVHDAVRGVELVFHLGALGSVPRSVQDPLTTSAVNVEGTLNVLLAARDEGVRRVVFASSSSVYGNAGDAAADASACRPTRSRPTRSRSWPRSATATASAASTTRSRRSSLRYFNVFGPRQNPRSQYAAVVPLLHHRGRRGRAGDDLRRRRAVARLHLRRQRRRGEPARRRRRGRQRRDLQRRRPAPDTVNALADAVGRMLDGREVRKLPRPREWRRTRLLGRHLEARRLLGYDPWSVSRKAFDSRSTLLEGKEQLMAHCFRRRSTSSARAPDSARSASALGVTAFGVTRRLPTGDRGLPSLPRHAGRALLRSQWRGRFEVEGEERILGPGGLCHVESTTPRKVSNAGDDDARDARRRRQGRLRRARRAHGRSGGRRAPRRLRRPQLRRSAPGQVTRKARGSRIVDAFLFSEPHEKEVLLVKLNLGARHVTEWVLIENEYTHQGGLKALHAREWIDGEPRFDPFERIPTSWTIISGTHQFCEANPARIDERAWRRTRTARACPRLPPRHLSTTTRGFKFPTPTRRSTSRPTRTTTTPQERSRSSARPVVPLPRTRSGTTSTTCGWTAGHELREGRRDPIPRHGDGPASPDVDE